VLLYVDDKALTGDVEALRTQLLQLTTLVNQLRVDVTRHLPVTGRNYWYWTTLHTRYTLMCRVCANTGTSYIAVLDQTLQHSMCRLFVNNLCNIIVLVLVLVFLWALSHLCLVRMLRRSQMFWFIFLRHRRFKMCFVYAEMLLVCTVYVERNVNCERVLYNP